MQLPLGVEHGPGATLREPGYQSQHLAITCSPPFFCGFCSGARGQPAGIRLYGYFCVIEMSRYPVYPFLEPYAVSFCKQGHLPVVDEVSQQLWEGGDFRCCAL